MAGDVLGIVQVDAARDARDTDQAQAWCARERQDGQPADAETRVGAGREGQHLDGELRACVSQFGQPSQLAAHDVGSANLLV